MKNSIILEKSYSFSLRIIGLYKHLINHHKQYDLARQILRCGTSIGANIEEADASISKKEFSAKVSISYKEARETKYWLRLLHDSGYKEKRVFNSLFSDCDELCKILFSILKSSGRVRTVYNDQ